MSEIRPEDNEPGEREPREREPLRWDGDEDERPRERSMSKRTIETAKNASQHPYVALVTALATAAGGYWAYSNDQDEDFARAFAEAEQQIKTKYEDKFWKMTAEDYHADMINAIEAQNTQIEKLRKAIQKLAENDRAEARKITSAVIESKPLPIRSAPPNMKPAIDPDDLKLEALQYMKEIESIQKKMQ